MNLNIGYRREIKKIIDENSVLEYAKISGDLNPIHLDSEYAKKTIFKKRIVHGMHSVSFISALISDVLSEYNCIYVSQNIKFLKPIYINEEITVSLVLMEVIPNKSLLVFATNCEAQGVLAIQGEAKILYLKK